MGKPKKPVRSKEQIINDTERKQEIARKKTIVIDQFYPSLINATVSVNEAKTLIGAISSLLMEQVLKTMQERKFSEIKDVIVERLCADGERKEEVNKLLSIFEGENLFVTREIIEGMTRAIEQMIIEDMTNRKLDTLKPNWEMYLN